MMSEKKWCQNKLNLDRADYEYLSGCCFCQHEYDHSGRHSCVFPHPNIPGSVRIEWLSDKEITDKTALDKIEAKLTLISAQLTHCKIELREAKGE